MKNQVCITTVTLSILQISLHQFRVFKGGQFCSFWDQFCRFAYLIRLRDHFCAGITFEAVHRLKTAGATFQRILNTIYCDYIYKFMIIYIDDLIIYSNSAEDALNHDELALKRASERGIHLRTSKCLFFSKSLDILGHQITPEGRRPSQKGTEAISKLSILETVTHVKRFLGLVGYFRDYIKNMSNRTVHLRNLLKKGTKFVWSSEHQKEFDDIKSVILSLDVILYHPDWSKPYQVETDASRFGIGAVLAQENNGSIRPVQFASRAFNDTESRWETMHQELYAVKWGWNNLGPMFLGNALK